MNEEEVLTGLANFLKARATALTDSVVVIDLGDAVPEEGARLHIHQAQEEIVAAGLCYLDIDLHVIVPAKQAGARASFTSACGFLRRALPPRDETQRDALAVAIATATSGSIALRFYHHGDSPADPPRDPHRNQRSQRLRLGLSGASI